MSLLPMLNSLYYSAAGVCSRLPYGPLLQLVFVTSSYLVGCGDAPIIFACPDITRFLFTENIPTACLGITLLQY
jgi:hypothetical protein